MARYFIDRPIFAWVIALIIMLVGAIATISLPIAQYPNIAPPPITVAVVYPGASAETVRDTVIQPIEQQMYGLDGLEYMSANAQADGSAQIVMTFKQGTNPNIAQVQVQNKLSLAQPMLPTEVVAQGLSVTKATRNFMLVASFISRDHSMDGAAIGDYLASNVTNPLARISGVGDYTLFGSEYAMRIWVKPERLQSYGLTISDLSAAISSQNIQVSSGEIGGIPARKGQLLDATVVGPTRFTDPEQFRNILLKVNTDGAQVRLRDVADVELNRQNMSPRALLNGQDTAGIAINLAPGANQMEVATAIKAELDHLKPYFPHGLDVVFPYDTAPVVKLSLEEVVETLLIAIVLVVAVMYLFLQNIRATLIPTIAVPVVLLGTFAVLGFFGFTINTLSMLGMVLAIGLLVDDAIVVVENVERLMAEEHLDPREATRKSMDQITGALVGIALVISTVFLPMAFFGGSAGVVYRQFSITIISAMLLSAFVAITFTPALCATLLKPHAPGHQPRGFFHWFNTRYDAMVVRYGGGVAGVLRHVRPAAVVYVALTGLALWCLQLIPGGFMPDEDQRTIFVQVQLKPGSTAEQTEKVNADIRQYFANEEKTAVQNVLSVMGFNFGGRAQDAGIIIVGLKDFEDRKGADQTAAAVTGRAFAHFATYKGARITPFLPPAVMELGNASGFDFELEDRGHLGHEKLIAARNQLLAMAAKDPRLMAVRPNGLDDMPQAHFVVDREKAEAQGVSIADINSTLQGSFGQLYVNQFTRSGRTKRVFIQGEPDSRMEPDDLTKWYLRNNQGQMVPLSGVVHIDWKIGAQKLERYNGVEAVEILGQGVPGVSTGQAMEIMKEYASKLPAGIASEWTSVSFEQEQSSGQAGKLYAVSIVAVLLCLAALYESAGVPIAVILAVPLGVLGAVLASLLRGLNNDIYFQVGLLTTVGLATKNAILIVEFAREGYDHGRELVDAAIVAAKERLRPILMTSFAFVLGTLPLAVASGAGAGSHIAIGTAVVGGMVGATILVVFLVPAFFVVVMKAFKIPRRKLAGPDQSGPDHQDGPGHASPEPTPQGA
ncbi:MAG TPA: efflux RND transporter permease subunit [Novosphingobium capsulatum]|nr:efflux RND transporter permease subunit [Novosphingobium aromaticivorans]HIQ18973.1 efflux RND transporter permease subunit [Novosphingobium capsulatum]